MSGLAQLVGVAYYLANHASFEGAPTPSNEAIHRVADGGRHLSSSGGGDRGD